MYYRMHVQLKMWPTVPNLRAVWISTVIWAILSLLSITTIMFSLWLQVYQQLGHHQLGRSTIWILLQFVFGDQECTRYSSPTKGSRGLCVSCKSASVTLLFIKVWCILLVIVWAGWHWKFVTCCENRVFEMVEIMSSFFKSRVKTSPSKLSKLRNKAMNILWDWLNHTI